MGAARESTEVARRTAVAIFPAMLPLHAIFVRALAPGLQTANLVAPGIASDPLSPNASTCSVEQRPASSGADPRTMNEVTRA
jgi:hypothetical protein